MKEFIATSNRQLGECIRLLSSYGLNGRFSTTFNKKDISYFIYGSTLMMRFMPS